MLREKGYQHQTNNKMSSPIQEGIDKLVEKGYVGKDILDIMVGIGWDAEDVRYAMNESYEKRAKENQELARQRKEALDSVSASYDELKKKSEPEQSDSFFGTFPGDSESAGKLESIYEIDDEVLTIAARDNALDDLERITKQLISNQKELEELSSMDASSMSSEERSKAEKRQAFLIKQQEGLNFDLRNTWSETESLGADLGDFVDIDRFEDVLIKSSMQRRRNADRQKQLGKVAQNAFRDQLGVEFPDIESIGDLNNEMLAMSFERAQKRMLEEQEAMGELFEDFDASAWQEEMEGIGGWENFFRGVGSELGKGSSGLVMGGIDLGEFMRENKLVNLPFVPRAFQDFAVGIDQVNEGLKSQFGIGMYDELLDYQKRQSHKDQIRALERKKQLVMNPDYWNLGTTEAYEKIAEDLDAGSLSQDQANAAWHGVTRNAFAEAMPSAIYYGSMTLMGPGGIGGIGASAYGSKYGDLTLNRPDLNMGEKQVIAGVVGTTEAVLNQIFRGAETFAKAGVMSVMTRTALKETLKKTSLESAKAAVKSGFGPAASKWLQTTAGEGLEEGLAQAIDWGITAGVDKAAGREYAEFNKYEILDAAIGGMLGGAGLSSIGLVRSASNRGHVQTKRRKLELQERIKRTRQKLAATQDSATRSQLNRELYHLNKEYRDLSAQEAAAYKNFKLADRARVMKLNQEIAFLEDMIKYKRDSQGKRLTKEDIEVAKTRLEGALNEKAQVEGKYDSVEKASADARLPESTPAPDVEGNEAPVESQVVAKDETKEEREAAPLAEKEDPVNQQGEQLSLFDETQDQEAPATEEAVEETVEEAPEQEAPVAEQTEEAPAQEEVPAKEEADPVKAQGQEVDVTKGLDLADRETVGEGGSRLTINTAKALNNALKGFKRLLKKAGTRVFVLSREDFDAIAKSRNAKRFKEIKDRNQRILGYYDVQDNKIVLPSDSRPEDVSEEFGHAFMLPVINGLANPKLQQELFNDLMNVVETKLSGKALQRFKAWKADRDSKYKDRSTPQYREEMIMGFFKYYAENSKDFIPVKQRIKQILHTVLKKAGHQGALPFREDSQLLQFAEMFKNMTEGVEQDIDITEEGFKEAQERAKTRFSKDETQKRADESEEEYRKRLEEMVSRETGMPTPEEASRQEANENLDEEEEAPGIDDLFSIDGRKKFTYLQDTEVFYSEDPYVLTGESRVFERSREKKAKFRDYFHFRNWYNYMTSNQTVDRIAKMYFIKDGKKYEVKPPKPKVDKQGKRIDIKGPENQKFANARIKEQRRSEEASQKNQARNAVFEFQDEAKAAMKASGIDSAEGMAFVPGFDYAAFEEVKDDRKSRFDFIADFREKAFFEKTPEESNELVELARKNMNDVRRNGMTAEEMQQADKSELFRPLIKPEAQREEGDVMDLFSIADEADLTPAYVNTTKGIKKYGKGSIMDIQDTFTIIMGFDMSTANVTAHKRLKGLGIKAGFWYLQQRGKIDGNTVLSSHVDRKTVEDIERRFRDEAEAIYKETGRTKGDLAVGFSFLSKESILGNPDVFSAMMKALIVSVESGREMGGLSPYQALEKIMRPSTRGAINSIAALDNYIPLSIARKIKKDPQSITASEFKQLVNGIIEASNDKKLGDGFQVRKNLMTKEIFDEFLRIERFERGKGDVMPEFKSRKWKERVNEYFGDQDFEGTPPGTLVGYRKFPYEFDPKTGEIKGLDVVEVPGSKGFMYALVSTTPGASDLKVMDKLYKLGDLNPDFRFKKEEAEDAEENKRGAAKKRYETPQDRALEANKRSGFELNQSKSLLEDDEAAARQEDDMFSIGPGPADVETDQGTFSMPTQTGFQLWRNLWIRRLVDKYNDIFNIQKAIEDSIGRVPLEYDFKMKEELMYGKAAQALAKLDEKVDNIKKIMKDNGVKIDRLNEYLYALHARERNQLIRDRIAEENERRAKNKKKLLPLNDAGSGMTDERADEIINSIQPRETKALQQLEAEIRKIQQDTRDTMVEFGLETQETIDAWDSMFSRYVPLAGIATDEQSEATSSYPTGGAGLSVFGPSTKRAAGRKTEAVNVLAQVIAQNAATHIKSRTNEAVRSLYDLAKANPNKAVWEVLDEANSLDPHVVSVRVDGEQKFIRFKDASHAATLKNMNLPETNLFVRILRAPSNWLRRSFTTLNPEFVVSNFARDIQTAVFNAAAEAEIEGGIMNGEKVMSELIKTVPVALKALMRGQVKLSQDAEMKRYYEEFKEDGAKTGWGYAPRLSDIAKELEDVGKDKTRTQEILGKGKNVVDFVEGMNEAFEDSVRLAAYIAARRNGVSREKAAQLAKNITVNFNKHGEWGQALNGVYLFFNASVQGTSRMFRTIGTLKPATRPDGTQREWYERANSAQKMAAGLTLFSAMVAMLNAGLSDEDEDDVLFYDKIPDYVKERNLIIMNPRDGKTYYKIPLPYGFNIFSNIGTVAADVARGGMEVGKGMHFLAQGLVNAFSPISFGQSDSFGKNLVKSGIPTVAKPFFDAWGFNETYYGGPVAAEQLPFGTKRPESSMSFRSPEAVKDFFSWMNRISGGSDQVTGGIDINPDRMWYVFDYFVGGAGNFVGRTGKTIQSVRGKFKDSDYDISVNDIPFVRVMYGEQSRYYDHGKYRDNETKVRQLYLERKETRNWSDARYDGILELNNKLKITNRKLKSLRDERRKARDIKDWTKRSIKVQQLMDEERRVIMEFNRLYDGKRKD